jgi:PEP-CTERM motif
MKALTTLISAAALAASVAAVSLPAHAGELLGLASETKATPTGNNFSYTQTGPQAGSFGTTVSPGGAYGATTVKFNFDSGLGVDDFQNLSANFTLFATGTGAALPPPGPGATFTQTGLNGTFSFVYEGPTQVIDGKTLTAGDNLLSGSFSNAWVQGIGTGGSFTDEPTNGGLVFDVTSHFVGLTTIEGGDFSFDLTGASGISAAAGQSLGSFRASSAGTLDITVPEPSTWALMIMGFGGAGALLRRRRMAAVAA